MTQEDGIPALETRRRRPWIVVLPLAIILLLAVAWSGFWYYAAGAAEAALADWQAREAALGRTYRCEKQGVSGFPFRFELRCVGPSARFDSGPRPAALAARDFVLVSQVWQPTLIIAEMIGPLTIGEVGQPPALSLNWSLAQASLRGLPTDPERASLTMEQLAVSSLGAGSQTMLANAARLELHWRVAAGSARQNPVLDLALNLTQASASQLGPLAAAPIDADIVGVLRGLKDLSPKSWPDAMRALQAANGRLDITRARIKQGDLVAVGAGTLGLSPRGALDGELQVTVTDLESILPALGIDRAISQLVPPGALERIAPGLDRLLPGLGGVLRGNAAPAAKAGIDALGTRTELEGKSAVTVPLRFADGTVFLGPFRLTQIPPLY